MRTIFLAAAGITFALGFLFPPLWIAAIILLVFAFMARSRKAAIRQEVRIRRQEEARLEAREKQRTQPPTVRQGAIHESPITSQSGMQENRSDKYR